MTTKQFIKKLEKALEGEFVIYTNKDKCFEHCEDDHVTVCGEDENSVFAFKLLKVKI